MGARLRCPNLENYFRSFVAAAFLKTFNGCPRATWRRWRREVRTWAGASARGSALREPFTKMLPFISSMILSPPSIHVLDKRFLIRWCLGTKLECFDRGTCWIWINETLQLSIMQTSSIDFLLSHRKLQLLCTKISMKSPLLPKADYAYTGE